MPNIRTQLQSISEAARETITFLPVTLLIVSLTILIDGCSRLRSISVIDEPNYFISPSEIEYLNNIAPYLPMLPDSIVSHYRHYDKKAFYINNERKITYIIHLIDSLNAIVGPDWSIDTLSIDHSLENFGTAAYQSKTLYLSSSYFFMYSGMEVMRSIITHEFGHIFYSRLIPYEKSIVNNTWITLEKSALLYLFHDGEYSNNARFGGHPEDSSEELFASAYNLFTNQREEFEFRLKYIDNFHLKLINDYRTFVKTATSDRHLFVK